jgi:HlyD family secretion protein
MNRSSIKKPWWILLALVAAAGLAWAFRPLPVLVETGTVTRGPMTVTVDNEGKTRVKDRYIVSAPLAGRLQRISLKPGDAVEAGKTLVAVIDATNPELLNPRSLAEAGARVKAAEATLKQAGSHAEQARIRLEYADRELDRIRTTASTGAASQLDLETAEQRQRSVREDIRAADFAEQVAKFELEQARAALDFIQPPADGASTPPRFEIVAPIDGRVFRVFEESATVVSPGTRLLEFANTSQLEIEVDLLTTRAVQIHPGTRMIIDHWGGDQPLEARVRVIEPSAFTKVSALGIEEQRVNVIADFTSPPEQRTSLGDGFRIEARLVVWSAEDVLKVPAGALFREQGEWSVFILQDQRASLRRITLGQRNDLEAEVLDGLQENDVVILYPNDQIEHGTRVTNTR